MTLLLVVVGIAIVAGVAVLALRDQPVIEDDPVRGRALHWPPDGPITPDSLAGVRFTVALRGYRMDEVDRVLDDATAALAQRDLRIAELERALGAEPAQPFGTNPEQDPPDRPEPPAGALAVEESR